MCLAVPGKIQKRGSQYAWVDFGGITKKIKITLTPSAKVGEYVIVHAGFSIQKLDAKEAKSILKIFNNE